MTVSRINKYSAQMIVSTPNKEFYAPEEKICWKLVLKNNGA
jgi:hypothetical protein